MRQNKINKLGYFFLLALCCFWQKSVLADYYTFFDNYAVQLVIANQSNNVWSLSCEGLVDNSVNSVPYVFPVPGQPYVVTISSNQTGYLSLSVSYSEGQSYNGAKFACTLTDKVNQTTATFNIDIGAGTNPVWSVNEPQGAAAVDIYLNPQQDYTTQSITADDISLFTNGGQSVDAAFGQQLGHFCAVIDAPGPSALNLALVWHDVHMSPTSGATFANALSQKVIEHYKNQYGDAVKAVSAKYFADSNEIQLINQIPCNNDLELCNTKGPYITNGFTDACNKFN